MLDSGFHALGFRIPGTSFQSFSVGLRLRIPIVSRISHSLSCIPNSKPQDSGFHKQNFPDSGNHKQNFPGFRIPQANFSRILDSTSKIFPDSGFYKQNFPGFRIPQTKFSRIPDSICKSFMDSGFPYMGRTFTYKLALKELVERI